MVLSYFISLYLHHSTNIQVKSISLFLSIYRVRFKQIYTHYSTFPWPLTPLPASHMTLTAFWWMCHFSPFVWKPHQHFTACALFSQKSLRLETPSPLWALSVIPRPLQLRPSIWTGVQFQSAITRCENKELYRVRGSLNLVHSSHQHEHFIQMKCTEGIDSVSAEITLTFKIGCVCRFRFLTTDWKASLRAAIMFTALLCHRLLHGSWYCLC